MSRRSDKAREMHNRALPQAFNDLTMMRVFALWLAATLGCVMIALYVLV